MWLAHVDSEGHWTNDRLPPPHFTVLFWSDRRQGNMLTGVHVRAMHEVIGKYKDKRFLVVRRSDSPIGGTLDPDGELASLRRELVAAANTADKASGGTHELIFRSTDGTGEAAIAHVHCSAGFKTPDKPLAELLEKYPSLSSEWAEGQARTGARGFVFRLNREIKTLMAPLQQNEALFQALLWVNDSNHAAAAVAKANEPLVDKQNGKWARVGKGCCGIGSETSKKIATSSSA